MDTYTQRASVSFTYSITVVGFLCLAIAISSLFYYTPESAISIKDCSVSKVVDLFVQIFYSTIPSFVDYTVSVKN